MADTSLDDFFAKKDKNKKKIRNKSTADVAIQQNSSVRKIKKKKRSGKTTGYHDGRTPEQ